MQRQHQWHPLHVSRKLRIRQLQRVHMPGYNFLLAEGKRRADIDGSKQFRKKKKHIICTTCDKLYYNSQVNGFPPMPEGGVVDMSGKGAKG